MQESNPAPQPGKPVESLPFCSSNVSKLTSSSTQVRSSTQAL